MHKLTGNYMIYLLAIVPVALVTGPFIPDLIISILGLFGIFIIIKEKKINYIKNKYSLLFFTFYTIILLSSLFSDDIIFSFQSSLFYFRFYFFSIIVFYLLKNFNNTQYIFLYFLTLTFFIVSCDGIYEYFMGQNILGYSASNSSRIAGFFNDEWVIGSYLVRLLPLMVYLYLNNTIHNHFFKYFFYLSAILSMITILISGERAAYLLLIFYISTFYFFYLYKDFKIIKLIIIPLVITWLAIPFLLGDKTSNRITADLTTHTSINKSQNVYLAMYSVAFQMFLDRPILGHGTKFFRINCEIYKDNQDDYGCNTHPHNLYLQFLSETGIIGFSFIFFIFLSFIKKLIYLLKDNNILMKHHLAQCSLLCCFIITLWPLLPTGSFFNNWLSVIYYLPMGFFLNTVFDKNFKNITN